MRTPTYFNKTFNIGETHFNACVGNNGIQDHETYGLGYHEAIQCMIDACKKHSVTLDAIIYPLVFCARHRIELFLKDNILKFKQIRENKKVEEKVLQSTHDLEKLWNLFKNISTETDRRFIPFRDKAEDYILDFSEMDPTGETFRYPYDKYKTIHMEETPIVNILIFENRYNELSEMMEEFEYLTNTLIYEYAQNTFTPELSREDLRQISHILPSKDTWSGESFDKVKEKIQSEFGLSNRKLSKAIDIIKNHKEFSHNIGIEKPLIFLTPKELSSYLETYRYLRSEKIYGKKTFEKDQLEEVRHADAKCVEKVRTELSREAIVCLFTLIELGKLDYYSEALDFLYEKYDREACDDMEILEYCSYIINNTQALRYIEKACRKINQSDLLSILGKK